MGGRARVRAALGGLLGAVLVVTVVVAPASARWAVHNSNDVTQMTAPPGGTEEQTCADAVVGETGWSIGVFSDDLPFDPPAHAYLPVTYHVWQAPAGFTSWNQSVGVDTDSDGIDDAFVFVDPQGNETPATRLTTFETPPRELLPEPLPIFGVVPGEENVYVFTAAAFTSPLPAGVAVGDLLAIVPDGVSTLLPLTVVDCGPPPPVTARVDVLPGLSTNYVLPRVTAPILPVLVYGSAELDVTTIAQVSLGDAAPAQVPRWLAGTLTPRDVDRDGHLDRLYWFSPAATGIACGQTSVDVTGTTTSGQDFTGTDSVRVVCRR